MKIAITGGGGFIGMATIRYAEEKGHEAWAFDRSNGDDVTGDLDSLKGAHAVIHLAGVLGTHELFNTIQDAIDINITGSYRVMQWCIDNGARYVGITMPDAFPSIYTATKIASQRLATALHHSRGLECAHVRAFNAFGPGQKYGHGHPQKIIPTFIMAALRKEPLPIWGTGDQTVDLIYVDDIAKMLVTVACHSDYGDNKIYDAGTGIAFTVNRIASMVESYAGSPYLRLHMAMRDGEIPTKIVAQGEGWDRVNKPVWDDENLRTTVDWYRENVL